MVYILDRNTRNGPTHLNSPALNSQINFSMDAKCVPPYLQGDNTSLHSNKIIHSGNKSLNVEEINSKIEYMTIIVAS